MYLEKIDGLKSTALVKIKYDCCGKEHVLKLRDAEKNLQKNDGLHKCRPCWLRSDANPAKQRDVQNKIKKTNLKRYGETMPMNSQEAIEVRRQKFQDEEWKEQWLEKHKQTSMERYGVDHPMKTEEVRTAQKAAMQEKYGVDHPYQSEEIMAKMKANNLEKYGVENVAELPEVQIKMAQTRLERYGVEHYNQLPQMKDYLREHCRDWLKESWDNPWAKGIVRPEEWNKKASETIARLIVEGKWTQGNGGKIRGYFTSKKCKKQPAFFRSYLELFVHEFLTNNSEVKFYDYEPFGISYTEGNLERIYIPDFIFMMDNILHLIEAKPEFKIAECEIKINAGFDMAEKYNMKFEIWTERKINQFGFQLEDLIAKDYVRLL